MAHIYTENQKEFIRENIKGKLIAELTKIFNDEFGLKIKDSQMRAFVKNHKLKSGIDCRFQKGHEPIGAFKKGEGGHKPTQFKKGHRPQNYRPIGSERINIYGYTEVKTGDPSKWELKHKVIWEKHNGPVPDGCVIVFADRDKSNMKIDNLLIVTKKQLAMLNKNNLIKTDATLTKTGIIIADVLLKIGERKRAAKEKV